MLTGGPRTSAQSPPTTTIVGDVRDSNGRPVANASVHVEAGHKPDVAARSDASGNFTLSISGAAACTIYAEQSGMRSLRTPAPAASHEPIHLVLDQKSAASSSSTSPMEFADQPNFTVAGVTDWTAAGGHGSDISLRTSEALTRETITLKPQGAADDSPGPQSDRGHLEQARQKLKQKLAQGETAELDRKLAELEEELGDPLAAVHEYERAARLEASEQNYFEWGSELLLHRAVWQAAQVFAEGSKAFPKSARMLAGLGTALFASARYDEAALRLCEASDLDPAMTQPYLFMGKVEIAAPTPLPCIEDRLARFAAQQPQSALASYYYAMAILKRQPPAADPKDIQKVEMLLNRAVTLDAGCSDAYLQLGLLAFAHRDYQRAISDYGRAVAADPRSGEAHYRLGVAYDRMGAAEQARREFAVHDQLEKAQADAVERERREVKQFVVELQGQPVAPPVH